MTSKSRRAAGRKRAKQQAAPRLQMGWAGDRDAGDPANRTGGVYDHLDDLVGRLRERLETSAGPAAVGVRLRLAFRSTVRRGDLAAFFESARDTILAELTRVLWVALAAGPAAAAGRYAAAHLGELDLAVFASPAGPAGLPEVRDFYAGRANIASLPQESSPARPVPDRPALPADSAPPPGVPNPTAGLPAEPRARLTAVVLRHREFRRGAIESLRPVLQALLLDAPPGTVAGNIAVAREVNDALRDLGLAIVHPDTGLPAIVVADRKRLVIEQRRRDEHGRKPRSSPTVDLKRLGVTLDLIEAPREEAFKGLQTGPGREPG